MLAPQTFADHEAMSLEAARWLWDRMTQGRHGPICLASGGTPTRMYQLVAEKNRRHGAILLDPPATFLKLDEWGGLEADDPGSCEFHLRSTLVEPLGTNCIFEGFHGSAPSLSQECERIANWLRENGPLKACVLGLGLNGHLGFNEPAKYLQPHAHVTPLSTTSLEHAMLGGRTVRPTQGITLGMADLLQADEILLVVSGENKREAVRRLLTPEIDSQFPASFLWLHPRVHLYCDAASCPSGARASDAQAILSQVILRTRTP